MKPITECRKCSGPVRDEAGTGICFVCMLTEMEAQNANH